MDGKYKGKYRISSARLQSWDYRWAGAYFITICTHNREHYFGEVVDGKMKLSSIGVIADILLYEINHRTKNVQLGEFVVMPNHIHVVLILINDSVPVPVETLRATSLRERERDQERETINEQMANISPKSGSVSTIIRSYKSAVTKHAHRLGFEFGWQTRFYDHIIRDETSFNYISNYIINNPQKWSEDKFYKNQ